MVFSLVVLAMLSAMGKGAAITVSVSAFLLMGEVETDSVDTCPVLRAAWPRSSISLTEVQTHQLKRAQADGKQQLEEGSDSSGQEDSSKLKAKTANAY